MRFDRRRFLKLGAAGAVGAAACGGSRQNPENAATPLNPVGSGTGAPELQVDFEGLYIIEGKGSGTKVHLVNGAKVGYPTHVAELTALEAALDVANTSPADRIVTVGADKRWIWDLTDMTVEMPKADSGPDTLDSEDSSGEDAQETPATEAGWHSLRRVPDLKKLSGATKVSNTAAVSAVVVLKHGHLGVLKPGAVGANSVWKFEYNGAELDKASFSNKVRYTRKNNGNPLTIALGAKKVVFKPAVTTNVTVSNLLPGAGCGTPPCTPNMNHFAAFLQVVDAKTFPTVSLAKWTPPAGSGVEPDYCPGSRC